MSDDVLTHIPALRLFARSLTGRYGEADDLVQDTLVRAISSAGSYTPGTNMRAWLFTIMRNRFYSDLRTQRRRPLTIDKEAATPLPAVDNPEATMALKELSSELWKLNPQSREALVLIGAGGFSYEEAAAICGCAVGTIKSRVGRARAALSEMLANGSIPRRSTDDDIAHSAILEELEAVAGGNGVSTRG